MPKLEDVFDKWMNQCLDNPSSTNGDLVRHANVSVELLQHLATFVWREARGEMTSAEFNLKKLDYQNQG